MKKNIVFIYPNSFPIAGSATNRLISLCRGLINSGNNVEVIINRPTEKPYRIRNYEIKGNYFGIQFEYCVKKITWPHSKLRRFLVTIQGLLLSSYKIIKKKQKKEIDILISTATYSIFENLLYFIISRLTNLPLIYTVDEYPWVIINKNKYNFIYRWLYLKYFYKLFDGFIVMTNTLLEYYKSKSKKNAKFIHIPMTVELDRFNKIEKLISEKYIAYCGGDFNGTKDGIDILIKAFYIIKDSFPNLFLYIIGTVPESIKQLVEELGIKDRVKLLGFIERDKVPIYLMNALALCLSRPNTIQNQGGFPTKLGEYLATGKPVIVTKVGEIENYLKDGVNAFISEPNSVEKFAQKINELLSDYNNAKKIGRRGKEIAQTYFNYIIQGKRLSQFLDDFLN